ncbi:MAG TPA: hypothetical protein VFR21_10890 [Bradyrhizobium sp.]|jgi:hypothetical protein|nr:hypothetical protein [Bradyrhizobium sp.]
MVAAFPTDIQRSLDALRRFNRKVDHLKRSGFAIRYAEKEPNVIAKFDDVKLENLGEGRLAMQGWVRSRLEDFNQDEIDAFVLTYRIFTQNNDAISIASLAKIYGSRWVPVEARDRFEEARREVSARLDSPATVMFGETRISIGTIRDVVIYGGMAHTNAKKTAVFESWNNSGLMGFIWAEFFAHARMMLKYLEYFQQLNSAVLSAMDEGFVEPE